MKQCDEFLVKLHHVKNKPTKESLESNLTCSPLDYFVFRQDLIDKYPLYDETELKPYDFHNLKSRWMMMMMMILQVTHQVFIVILVLLKESINILWHYTIHPILFLI